MAVTRRGSWVHVIAAHDLDTLRTKIEAAQREETTPAPAPSLDLTAAAGFVINRLVL